MPAPPDSRAWSTGPGPRRGPLAYPIALSYGAIGGPNLRRTRRPDAVSTGARVDEDPSQFCDVVGDETSTTATDQRRAQVCDNEQARITHEIVTRLVDHDSSYFLVRRLAAVEASDDIDVVAKQDVERRLRGGMNDSERRRYRHYFAAARLASTFEIPSCATTMMQPTIAPMTADARVLTIHASTPPTPATPRTASSPWCTSS